MYSPFQCIIMQDAYKENIRDERKMMEISKLYNIDIKIIKEWVSHVNTTTVKNYSDSIEYVIKNIDYYINGLESSIKSGIEINIK